MREIPRRLMPDESVVAYRSWRIDLETMADGLWGPVLVGGLSGVRWATVELQATCDQRLRQGDVHSLSAAPAVACSCGIYGASTPDAGFAWEFAGWPALGATAPTALAGRVYASSTEYRGEQARIVGPLEVRIGCAADRCARRADFMVGHLGLPSSACGDHVVEVAQDAGSIGFVREFATELYARLEDRYGLPVLPG
jgi:hypothetical protein